MAFWIVMLAFTIPKTRFSLRDSAPLYVEQGLQATRDDEAKLAAMVGFANAKNIAEVQLLRRRWMATFWP